MRVEESALKLTVSVGETRQWHHRPVYVEIVRRARAAGLAGAAVYRGIEGYGASRQLHTARVLSLTEDLPVTVVIVDTADRIHAFLPQLDEVVTHGLVTVDEVHAIRYLDPGEPGAGEGGADEPAR